jgi:hypothetical protein
VPPKLPNIPLLFAVLLLTNGCAGTGLVVRTPDSGNTNRVRYWVLGFGVVSVEAPERPAACVVQTRAMGLHVASSPTPRLSLGYSFSHTTAIPEDAQIVIEVEQKPFATPTVSLPSTEQEQSNLLTHENHLLTKNTSSK